MRPDSETTWRKSSHSSYKENCIEIAGLSHAIALRDSKDPNGPALVVSRSTFAQFVRQVRES